DIWGQAWDACGIFIVKGYHVTEFAILTLLAHLALRRCETFRARALPYAFLLSAAYAALDEWHQTFTPGRGGRVSDVAIDLIGISVTALFIRRTSIFKKSGSSSANTP